MYSEITRVTRQYNALNTSDKGIKNERLEISKLDTSTRSETS